MTSGFLSQAWAGGVRKACEHNDYSAGLSLKNPANFYENIRSMVLVSHKTATSFRICFIKVYFQRHLNNYKIEIPGYGISKSDTGQAKAVCKGDDPTLNAVWSLPQSHQLGLKYAKKGSETVLQAMR